jgi:predicted nucleic acid-binding protein
VILFTDSSALVKLYIREAETDTVRATVARADRVAAAWIAYAEVRAALAAAERGHRYDPPESYRTVVTAFESDWARLVKVAVSEAVIREAGALAERYALRGYDAVHLATALALHRASPEEMTFVAYDPRLRDAARASSLAALP